VAEIQFQNVIEVAKEEVVNDSTLVLSQTAEDKLKFIPGLPATCMALVEPLIHFGGGEHFAIVNFPSQCFGFFGNHGSTDAVDGIETTKQISLWHGISLNTRCDRPHVDVLDSSGLDVK